MGVGVGTCACVGIGVGACVGLGVGVGAITCVGVGVGVDFTTGVDAPQAASTLLTQAIQRTVTIILVRIPVLKCSGRVDNVRHEPRGISVLSGRKMILEHSSY